MTITKSEIRCVDAVAAVTSNINPDLRRRLRAATAAGAFHFPDGSDTTTLIERVWAKRDAIVAGCQLLDEPLARLLLPDTTPVDELTNLCCKEMAAAEQLRDTFLELHWSLKAGLIAARKAYHFSDHAPRRVSARTSAPEGGISIVYPSPERILDLLASLEQIACSFGQDEAGLAAAVAYGGTIHAHAFRDGNKRTGRLLWAGIVSSVGGTPLPLALLSNIDRRAFHLQMRRLILFGHWEPLLSYLTQAAWVVQNAV